MGATYIHEGNAIDFVPGTQVNAGDVVVVGDLVGVARVEIKANQRGSLAVTGVFEFPKASGEVIGAGQQLYWDHVAKRVATSSDYGGYKRLGHAVAYAGSGEVKVQVRLMSGFPEVPDL
ncbi:MAG TPA: DUF2190 family protein [Phycisphaerae bacterium]|nr:DUF2190 family protein [Phycisphaerae bacterium]